jgi:uncharacterized protein (DUF2249 family)
MSPTPDEGATTLVEKLAELLNDSLKLWRDIRPNDAASILAAKGYLLLRESHPRAAERLNGTLHLLTRELPPAATAAGERLDVRALPPAERHRLIFDTWARLAPGAAFVLVNDHDPKPLYYQFAAEEPGRFTWEELEMGPTVWRVRIGKTPTSGGSA